MSTQATTHGDQTAMADLQKAIETHAKLCLMARQLPERISAAQEAVDAAYERLGIPSPARRPVTGRTRGETTEAILALLPATQPEIREATGMPPSTIAPCLNRLVTQGRVVSDDTTRPRTYRRAEG